VQDAIRVFDKSPLILMHCTTEYPCPYDEVNLMAMQQMHKKFGCPVGYSDHTQGIDVSIAAVALGASVIEKHLTLDCTMKGPDHKASLEPKAFKMMIDAIRRVEKSLGDGDKRPSFSEIKNIAVVRKSIVTKCAIKKGDVFTEKNLTTRRPGDGVSPMKWDDIIGKRALCDCMAFDKIIMRDVEGMIL
jgi:N,N'-diacetyllegionaminate synthase